MRHFQTRRLVLMLAALCALAATLSGQTDVLGEVQLEGVSNVEKSSGVWVDGQYVGYLNELKGSKKILLLPGEHQITVKQAGYLDFNQKVVPPDGVNGGDAHWLDGVAKLDLGSTL